MEHAGARITGDAAEVADAASPVHDHHARREPPADSVAPVAPAADELSLWLRGLDSFFRWQHHPQPHDRPSDPGARDWKAELRIARETLTRARHLALSSRRPPSDDLTLDHLGDADADAAGALGDATLGELDAVLGDAEALCDGLLAAERVEFRAWHSFGRSVSRLLRETSIELERLAHDRPEERRAHPALRKLAVAVAPPELSADLLFVFERLTELLDVLAYVAPLLRADRPLKQALPLFTLVHDEAERLIAFIEKRALRTEGTEGELFDALDSVAYALGMELRKTFLLELGDLAASRDAAAIYSKTEIAHGLLRDALQQSVVTLAQAIDPDVRDVDLFDAVRTKLERSLRLRADIWSLLCETRRAEKRTDAAPDPLARVVERSRSFREGSMRYLMYKDWEAFELFLEELARARGAADALPVLHRFATYLDTLFGQINMRAVLKDHPFEPEPGEEFGDSPVGVQLNA